MDEWFVYLLVGCNNKRTYIGASNNPERRLKCHNGELSGGARSTRTARPWKHICIIGGLDKTSALQLEWRLKKWVCPKNGKLTNCPGLRNRINNIFIVLHLEKWTSNAVLSNTIPLHIRWYIDDVIIRDMITKLPTHITSEFI